MYEVDLWVFGVIGLVMIGILVITFWPASAAQLRDQNDPRHSVEFYPSRTSRFKAWISNLWHSVKLYR